MPAPRPRPRVAGYVIRRRGDRPALLVFDHVGIPEAGTQVPAGGIESGENLSSAVAREVLEETGLTGVTVVGGLGVEEKPHPETGQPRRTTYFHLLAPPEAPDAWEHRVTSTGEDDGLLFACRFEPLPLSSPLEDHQDVFLDRIDPRWGDRRAPTGGGDLAADTRIW